MADLDEILRENNITVDINLTNSVIVTVGGQDQQFTLDQLGLTMESTNAQVLAAVQGIITEMGQSLQDSDNDFVYQVVKATNSNNIYVVPKSDWGK